MKKFLLYGTGIAVLGYALYRYFRIQSDLLSNYEYRVVGIKIRSLSLQQVVFDLVIRFSNKSDIQATVKKIYLDFYVEDVNVGFVTEEKSFTVPAQGQADVPLTFYFDPQKFFKNAVSMILGTAGKKDVNLRIKGYASAKSGLVSTTIPIDYATTLKTYLGN